MELNDWFILKGLNTGNIYEGRIVSIGPDRIFVQYSDETVPFRYNINNIKVLIKRQRAFIIKNDENAEKNILMAKMKIK